MIGTIILILIVIVSIVYVIYQRREKARVIEFELEDKFESKILIEKVKSKEKRKIIYIIAAVSLILLTSFALTKTQLEVLRKISIFGVGTTILIAVIVVLIVYFIYHRREKARVIDFELENYREEDGPV